MSTTLRGLDELMGFVTDEGCENTHSRADFSESTPLHTYSSKTITRHKRAQSSLRGETSQITNVYLKDLLQQYLCNISEKCALKPELVLKIWPQVVGPQIASMTKPLKFDGGVLYITVKNSTLLSLLSSGNDKKRLLQEISSRLPGVGIQDLVFRFG